MSWSVFPRRVRRWSNQYALTIPMSEAKRMGIQPGDEVVVAVVKPSDDTINVASARLAKALLETYG